MARISHVTTMRNSPIRTCRRLPSAGTYKLEMSSPITTQQSLKGGGSRRFAVKKGRSRDLLTTRRNASRAPAHSSRSSIRVQFHPRPGSSHRPEPLRLSMNCTNPLARSRLPDRYVFAISRTKRPSHADRRCASFRFKDGRLLNPNRSRSLTFSSATIAWSSACAKKVRLSLASANNRCGSSPKNDCRSTSFPARRHWPSWIAAYMRHLKLSRRRTCSRDRLLRARAESESGYTFATVACAIYFAERKYALSPIFTGV